MENNWTSLLEITCFSFRNFNCILITLCGACRKVVVYSIFDYSQNKRYSCYRILGRERTINSDWFYWNAFKWHSYSPFISVPFISCEQRKNHFCSSIHICSYKKTSVKILINKKIVYLQNGLQIGKTNRIRSELRSPDASAACHWPEVSTDRETAVLHAGQLEGNLSPDREDWSAAFYTVSNNLLNCYLHLLQDEIPRSPEVAPLSQQQTQEDAFGGARMAWVVKL